MLFRLEALLYSPEQYKTNMLIYQASTISATVPLMRCRGKLRLQSSAVCQSRFLLFMCLDFWNESLHVELAVSTQRDHRASLVSQKSFHSSQQPERVQAVTGRSWGQRYIFPPPASRHMVLCCWETLTDFPEFSPNSFLKAFRRDQFLFSGASSRNNLLSKEQKTWFHFLLFPKRTPTHCCTVSQIQDWKISLNGDDDPEGKL